MSVKLVNLTQLVVEELIDQMLESYPHQNCRSFFQIPENRKKLISYVLNRVDNQYAALDPKEATVQKSQYISQERSDLEAYIHQGISYLTSDEYQEAAEEPSQDERITPEPSHWFG